MDQIFGQDGHFRESRLPSLFSDFGRLRETNLEGFKANIDAWRGVLVKYMQMNDGLFTTYEDMAADLEYKGKKPLGLYLALDHLVNEDHTVVPLSEFEKSPVLTDYTRKGDNGVVNTLIGLVWSKKYCNRLKGFKSLHTPKEAYILLEKLDHYSEIIKTSISNAGEPIDRRQLYDIVNHKAKISINDFDLCLLYLQRDLGEIRSIDENVIMRVDSTSEVLINSRDAKIELEKNPHQNEDLKVMASLNFIIYKMESYSDEKHQQIDDLRNEILEDLRKNHKIAARAKQRRSRVIQKQLEGSIDKLEQLNILKLKLEEAANNKLVMKAFETNSQVLKKLNTCQMDVDNIMNDLMEEIDKTEGITSQLSEPLAISGANVDDESIDNELEMLQREIEDSSNNVRNDHRDTKELTAKLESLTIPKNDPMESKEKKGHDKEERVLLNAS